MQVWEMAYIPRRSMHAIFEFSFYRTGFDISNDRAVKLCLDGSYLGKVKTLRR
jgi:hypothetical protein